MLELGVILPSFNEATTIGQVVKIVDIGIQKLSLSKKAIIVNVDGNSQDGTREIFRKVKTETPKLELQNRFELEGKGANLITGIKKCSGECRYLMTFDTDLRSIRPDWVEKFYAKLKNHNDLVIPIYKRNRYEGNTTNHFSSPIIYSLFGKIVGQPIAGDFAFSYRLAKEIDKNTSCNTDLQYGIDTIITWSALLKGWPIVQVDLGEKIHNPSFPKIVPMFTQIAYSTFKLIVDQRKKIESQILSKDVFVKPYIHRGINDYFIRKPSESKIKRLKVIIDKMRVEDGFYLQRIDRDKWVEFLAKVLVKMLVHGKKEKLDYFVKKARYMYLLRVLSYFNEIETFETEEIKRLLENQTNKLASLVRNEYMFEVKQLLTQNFSKD